MSALVWVGVGLLGGVGALIRFGVDGLVAGRAGSEFPWGTFAVNVSGAFLLGVLTGAALHGDALVLAGTAVLGSYTTFSTWMFEAHRLGEEGELWVGLVNIGASIVVGVAAVALGRAIG